METLLSVQVRLHLGQRIKQIIENILYVSISTNGKHGKTPHCSKVNDHLMFKTSPVIANPDDGEMQIYSNKAAMMTSWKVRSTLLQTIC